MRILISIDAGIGFMVKICAKRYKICIPFYRIAHTSQLSFIRRFIMDYEKAAAYWTSRDEKTNHMPREALQAAIEAFAGARNTCALATGNGADIRCTPLEYTYKDGKFWIFSEGGLKFKGLSENSYVSLAIFEPFGGTGTAEGLQVMGKADIIEPWSPAYTALMEYKRLPIECRY